MIDDSDTDSQKQSRYYENAYFLEQFKNAPKIPGRTYQKARQANDRTILPTKIYTLPSDSTIDDATDTTEYIVFDDKIDRRSDDDDNSEEDYIPNYSILATPRQTTRFNARQMIVLNGK